VGGPILPTINPVFKEKRIKKIAGGYQHAIALADGEIIVTGTKASDKPNQMLRTKNIIDVASGGARHHMLALSSSGQVYSWGDNPSGELGHGDTADTGATPALVQGLDGFFVTQVFAGGHTYGFSAAVTRSGDVWMWGTNNSGQLGLPSSAGSGYNTPQQLSLQNVKTMSTGGDHTLFLMGNQNLIVK
jgi:alpha-tubulin suppressor-like RCC1 family protein